MRRNAFILLAAIFALLSVTSCNKEERDLAKHRNVLIVYAANFNNLSSAIDVNITQLCNENLPSLGSENAVVVFAHSLSKSGTYSVQTSPCIYRMYQKDGQYIRDTLHRYSIGEDSASKELFHSALSFIKEKLPADNYGLIFNSHGTGWIPKGYSESNMSLFSVREHPEFPETKSLGMMVHTDGSTTSEIDLKDFVSALPMKMDYIIFDACLMGCVEVAYELRNSCKYMVASPTEILKNGMVYPKMLEHLFNGSGADLESVCSDFFDYYNAQTGYAKSASISLIDCEATASLASTFKSILDAHSSELTDMYANAEKRNKVQACFYDEKEWFYDLRDIARNIGATQAELEGLDRRIDDCVVYESHTDKFFNLELTNICGMSCYIPTTSRTTLNEYYLTLDWDKATSLVR